MFGSKTFAPPVLNRGAQVTNRRITGPYCSESVRTEIDTAEATAYQSLCRPPPSPSPRRLPVPPTAFSRAPFNNVPQEKAAVFGLQHRACTVGPRLTSLMSTLALVPALLVRRLISLGLPLAPDRAGWALGAKLRRPRRVAQRPPTHLAPTSLRTQRDSSHWRDNTHAGTLAKHNRDSSNPLALSFLHGTVSTGVGSCVGIISTSLLLHSPSDLPLDRLHRPTNPLPPRPFFLSTLLQFHLGDTSNGV